ASRVEAVEDLGDARTAEQNAEGRLVLVTALVQRPQPRSDVRNRDASLPLRRVQATAIDDKLSPGDVELVARAVPRFDAGFEALVERVHLREHRVCLGALLA